MTNWTLEVGQVRQIGEGYAHRPGQKFIVERVLQKKMGDGDGCWMKKWIVAVFPDGTREEFDDLWTKGCSTIL